MRKYEDILLRFCPVILIFVSNFIAGLYNHNMINGLLFNPIPSLIIMYIFFFFLVFIFCDLKKVNYIFIILFFILLIINQIKIFYMQEPIYLSDILLLGGISEIISITNGTLINFFKENILVLLLQLILFVSIFIMVYKCHSIYQKRHIFSLIIFILFLVLSMPWRFTTSIMSKLYDGSNIDDYAYISNQVEYYMYYGVVGSLYGNMLENRIFKPINYDDSHINEVLKTNNQEISDDIKPNIILLFSESFFDLSKITDNIKFNMDILEDYHNLKKEGKVIQLISPTYGGLSSNVEFELLTSFNLAYYNKAYIPYLSLVKEKFYQKPNIPSELSNNGYKNYVFSAADNKLYNAGNVYNYFKFINNTKIDDNAQKGYYVSDHYVINSIINLIEKEDNQLFYFVKTLQSHMPYSINKYDKYNVKILDSDLSNDDQNHLLSYAEGIHDASIELKRLNDYIKTSKEKTIIIFLGDHLPYLNNLSGENILSKLSYFNTDNEILNIYRKYNTEALILSNYEVNFDSTQYLSPDLLIPYVLKSLNINMSSYYNYLINESSKILPSYNRYIYVNHDGKINSISKIDDKEKNEFEFRKSLQYKLYYME